VFIGSIFHSIVTVNDTLIIQEHERRIRSSSFDTYLQAILPHFTLVAEFSLQDTCYQGVSVNKEVEHLVFKVFSPECSTQSVIHLNLKAVSMLLHGVT